MSASELLLSPQSWPLPLAVGVVGWLLEVAERRREARRCAALGEAPPTRRRGLATLAMVLAASAFLEPARGQGEAPLSARPDLVVCLDVSRSMLATDASPSRLAAAQAALVKMATAGQGERLALVLFAGVAQLAVPLTDDAAAFAEQVEVASPDRVARGGSDLAAAIDVALVALRAAESRGGAIVLLTDGEDLSRAVAVADAAQRCRERGVVLHAVGFGSPEGRKIALPTAQGERFLVDREGREVISRLDEPGLAWLAEATGGSYVAARETDAPLDAIVSKIRRSSPPRFDASAAAVRPLFQWLLVAALLLGTIDEAAKRMRRKRAVAVGRAGSYLVALIALVTSSMVACAPQQRVTSLPGDDLATAASEWRAALAAEVAGDAEAAASHAELAAMRGAAVYRDDARFLIAALDFRRGEALSRRALAPHHDLEAARAGREALVAALADFAALAATDSEVARRNVERCLLRIEALDRLLVPPVEPPLVDETRRLAAPVALDSTTALDPTAPPDEPSAELAADEIVDPVEPPSPLPPQLAELDPVALAQLFERLAEKEAAKRAARSEQRARQNADVERDW